MSFFVQDVLNSDIVSSASWSCWLSAVWSPESFSSEVTITTKSSNALYPVTVTVRLWIWVTGWLNVVLTVLHNRSQNLTANMCLHHPHFLIFLSFKCNIVVINIQFKFTYSKGWQLVSVTEIFPVNVIVFLLLSFCTLLVIICSPPIFSYFNVSLMLNVICNKLNLKTMYFSENSLIAYSSPALSLPPWKICSIWARGSGLRPLVGVFVLGG